MSRLTCPARWSSPSECCTRRSYRWAALAWSVWGWVCSSDCQSSPGTRGWAWQTSYSQFLLSVVTLTFWWHQDWQKVHNCRQYSGSLQTTSGASCFPMAPSDGFAVWDEGWEEVRKLERNWERSNSGTSLLTWPGSGSWLRANPVSQQAHRSPWWSALSDKGRQSTNRP